MSCEQKVEFCMDPETPRSEQAPTLPVKGD